MRQRTSRARVTEPRLNLSEFLPLVCFWRFLMQLCLPTTGFTVIVQCFIFIARSFHISFRGCEVINNLGYTVCFFQPVQIPYGIKQVNTLKIRTTLGGEVN